MKVYIKRRNGKLTVHATRANTEHEKAWEKDKGYEYVGEASMTAKSYRKAGGQLKSSRAPTPAATASGRGIKLTARGTGQDSGTVAYLTDDRGAVRLVINLRGLPVTFQTVRDPKFVSDVRKLFGVCDETA
jgi:hypothetical protein